MLSKPGLGMAQQSLMQVNTHMEASMASLLLSKKQVSACWVIKLPLTKTSTALAGDDEGPLFSLEVTQGRLQAAALEEYLGGDAEPQHVLAPLHAALDVQQVLRAHVCSRGKQSRAARSGSCA